MHLTSYIYLYISKSNDVPNLEYGDVIKIEGDIKQADVARNYEGFDAKQYGKTINNYGSISATKITKIKSKTDISNIFFNIRRSIKEKISVFLPEETSGILLGILIGEKSDISKENMQSFRDSSLIHMLCVSGAHVVYVLVGLKWCISKISSKKKVVEICSIIGLWIFIGITRIFNINCKGLYNGEFNANC